MDEESGNNRNLFVAQLVRALVESGGRQFESD